MKKRALRKEFFMEIRKSLPRFLSILFIVALGTAFYSGIQSSSPDMRYSGDAYFDAKELSDIQVTGTMGVTGDDVEALQNLKDIETAEGVCLKDVLTGEEGQRKVLRILSIPEKSNLVTVEEGEYPTKENECLMDVQYAEHNGYQIGDTFRISEELEKDEDATLKSDTFTITGLCSSPLYISFSRGSTNVGNGEIAGFVYVPQETFTTDYYMQIYLKVKGAKELTAYTDAYDTTVAQAVDINYGNNNSGFKADTDTNITGLSYIKGTSYAGGFAGRLMPGDVAQTGSIKLLGLLNVNQLLSVMDVAYPRISDSSIKGNNLVVTASGKNDDVVLGDAGGYIGNGKAVMLKNSGI